MFLPVLLWRDYGPWGFVVFAIPNVIGAAAMGWVLRSHRRSLELSWRHEGACLAFSTVTIAFHVFFVAWIVQAWLGWTGVVAAGAVTATVLIAGSVSRAGDLVAAVGAWGLSIVLGALAGANPTSLVPMESKPWPDLLWLAPVVVFGFALCPYLDLTFHRARQSTGPGGGRFAFTVGFGVLFFAMILLTPLYAPPMVALLRGDEPQVSRLFRLAIGIHLLVQSGFTIAVHLREMGKRPGSLGLTGFLGLVAACAVAFLAGRGFAAGETTYRVFMGFYGLFFPAYAWALMCPLGRGGLWPTPRRLLLWLGAVAVAGPMFWMGFVGGRTIWLVPGLLVALLPRWLDRPQAQQNSAPTSNVPSP